VSTIAAIATPPGRGGVGVIRISGPGAAGIARRLCGRKSSWPARRAVLSSFLDARGEALDRGLVLHFPAPHSYTGEDVIELQGHGSPVLLRALLARVLDLGARMAEPGEFTRRAVENGRMTLDQAEAVAACIEAATLRAARQAERHLAGEFGRFVSGLMEEITGILADVEACLDFPEDDVPTPLFEAVRTRVNVRLLAPIRAALATAPFGERLFQGATVAIVGSPNVGKSSLLNRLAGRDRAIVSEVPGTTRDVLEVDFEVEGIPLRLVDTAGMRESTDIIEREGVRRAREAARDADLILMVADITRPETWRVDAGADIRVMNKVDLAPGQERCPEGFLPVSARSGEGVERLLSEMARHLEAMPLAEEGLLVTRERHRRLLERAGQRLEAGLALLGDAAMLDVVALEWRGAWSSLGEILGMGDVEAILDQVFARFCIGK